MRTLKQRKHALHFPKTEGRTEQSHVADCDINVILKRALRGQESPYVKDNIAEYGDQTSLDMFEASNIIKQGETMFANLPSKIRNRFKNNIGDFLDFIQDEDNEHEAYELGLINTDPTALPENPPIPEPPVPKPSTPPTPPEPASAGS